MKKSELEEVIKIKDNTIYNLQLINNKLKGKNKFSDIKQDMFIFSVVMNIIFTIFTTINAYGGIH
jgi:hypothetical protein